jgi:WD40 repeat protein
LKLNRIEKIDSLDKDFVSDLLDKFEPKPSNLKTSFKLPSYPGRQYKAVPSVHAEFSEGRIVVGTKDGMLAIVSDNGVYSLGPASPNGPIHAMTVTPDKTLLFGVAGDPDDIGSVFTYDDKNGLLWKGYIIYEAVDSAGAVCCSRLSCCSVSKDGKYLAIASNDRLGTVLLYQL